MVDKIKKQILSIQKKDKKRKDLDLFVDFLENGKDISNKDNYDGHLCGSSWIIDKKRNKTLLIKHPKLNKWMQPGGHIESNETPYETAIREMEEEANIKESDIKNTKEILIDAGIHEFKHSSKPEHVHYDLRYCFDVDSNKVKIKSENNVEIKWFDFKDVPSIDEDGTLTRMVEYSKNLDKKRKLGL